MLYLNSCRGVIEGLRSGVSHVQMLYLNISIPRPMGNIETVSHVQMLYLNRVATMRDSAAI